MPTHPPHRRNGTPAGADARVALFLQKRPHRAGAQVALARLFAQPGFRRLRPMLVTGREGWLTTECARLGIPTLVVPFPTSRSLGGRLFGNGLFVRRVLRQLRERRLEPQLVIGNDHYEGILVQGLARRTGARSVMLLRSADATLRDLRKYRCDAFDLLYATGDEFAGRVVSWLPAVEVVPLFDGLSEADFLPVKPKSAAFPQRVLVAGSEHPLKGWADLACAVDLLECDPSFPAIIFEFTGGAPDPRENDMQLERSRRASFRFIGRHERFAELVRQYDLVVNPTQLESFGLVSFEVLAAGVPLLCSRTGEIGKIRSAPEWLFAPGDVAELASRLKFLHERWPDVVPDVEQCREQIRRRFMIEPIADDMAARMQALVSPSSDAISPHGQETSA